MISAQDPPLNFWASRAPRQPPVCARPCWHTGPVRIDVALVPGEAAPARADVLVVVDQIRASTTLTVLLDLGCSDVLLTGTVIAARRLAATTGALLAGEHRARKPHGFDFDNSPSELSLADVRGRPVVLCTTNGTAILERVRTGAHVLVGALRNARACAVAADGLARGGQRGIQVVCAGRNRRFVAEDAVAAGVIVARIVEILGARGEAAELSDAAAAAVRLREGFPDLLTAMRESDGGATLRRIGQPEDIAFCAEEDASATVPVLRAGPPMRVVRLSP